MDIIDKKICKIKPSSTIQIKNKINNSKMEISNLGFGQSPFPVYPNMIKYLQKHSHQNSYLDNQGIPELRKEIAEYYNNHDGYHSHISPNNLIIGNGSKSLINLLFQVCDLTYIIISPYWPSYYNQLKFYKRKILTINESHFNSFKLSTELLEKKLNQTKGNPAIIILNYPNNPTGITYTELELIEISKVISKYDNIFVLADEIYNLMTFNSPFTSIQKFLPEKTILVNSLSKNFGAGGWRLGYMSIPSKLNNVLNIFNSIISETYNNVSAPIQYATLELFKEINNSPIEINNYLRKCNNILSKLSLYCQELLLVTNLTFPKAHGTWYLYLNFKNYKDKLNRRSIHCALFLEEYLLEKYQVSTLSCSNFNQFTDDLSLRVCLVDFDGKLALDNYNGNIDKLWIETYCSRVIKGIKQIILCINNL